MTLILHDELMGSDQKVNSHRFCCPIFITGMYGTLLTKDGDLFGVDCEEPEIRSGTLTFISYNDQIYGITCRHVVEALEGKNAKLEEHKSLYGDTVPFVAGMHFFFPKGNDQIHINARFHKAPGDAYTGDYPDVAIARISREKLAHIGRVAIPFDREVPHRRQWSASACGIATGYPEQNRRSIPSSSSIARMGISTVVAIAPFEHGSDMQLTMFYELTAEPEADNLSGMSGGPILWSEETGWGLVGIVKKGRDMKKGSDRNRASFLVAHAIWIEGEPFSRETFGQWVAEIPENEEPIKDISKSLYAPSGYPVV